MFLRIIVFYLMTWFFVMVLGGTQQATGILPPQIGLAQWAPGVSALLMLVIFRKDGFRINFFSKDTPLIRYLWAALIPAGVGLVLFIIRSLLPMESTELPEVYNNLLWVVVWAPIGAFGEEIGWRGYLHKKLDTRLIGLVSSLLVGLMWMPIHIHLFAQGPVYLFFFALVTISWSILIYALVRDTKFNVLLATTFHLSINLVNLLFLDVIYNTTFMMINAFVGLLVASILVLARRDLFFGSKI